MANPALWEGREFLVPGGYSRFKLQPAGSPAVDTSTMIIIGTSEAGTPWNAMGLTDDERVMIFNNSSDASKALKSGDLFEAVRLAFNPTSDPNLVGARRVIAIRSQEATQSDITLKVNDIPSILVKSREYGRVANSIAIEVDQVTNAESVTGSIITAYRERETIQSPAMYGISAKIIYTGSESEMTMTAENGLLKLNNGTTDIATYTLADYSSIQVLMESVATVPGITVDVISGDWKAIEIDDIPSTSIKDSAKYITVAHAEQLRYLNNVLEYTNATYIPGTGNRKALSEMPKTYMQNGTTSAATINDYIGAISLAEKHEAFYQIEISGDIGVAMLNSESVKSSCDHRNRRERIGGSGAKMSMTYRERQEAARALNNMFYNYSASPITIVNGAGERVMMDPRFHIVASLAINSGNGPTTSSTAKPLSIIGNPEKYTVSEKEDFIRYGCQIVDRSELTGSYKTVRSVTTYQGVNLIASEMSMVATALAIAKDFRVQLEYAFVGRAGTEFVDAIIESKAKSLLDGYLEAGFLTQSAKEKAYNNLSIKWEGDKFYISVDGVLTAPINFIFNLLNFKAVGL